MLFVYVGDPLQLPPVIKTKSMNTADLLVNPFADQMSMSFSGRMWRRRAPVIMFTEQHRAAAGLEQVYNTLFYGGRITNSLGTALAHRPKARACIAYIKIVHKASDGIPHCFMHIPTGACMRSDVTKSRYNLHNIIVVLHEVVRLHRLKIWTEEEISIITLYREQAKCYRRALAARGFWYINVITVDLFQGG